MAIKAEAITPNRATASVPPEQRAKASVPGRSVHAEDAAPSPAEAMLRYVLSVNGKTGKVWLTAKDVGALPDTTVIPTKTSQLENDSGFISEAEVNYPVTSVNGKTGAVQLDASDVGALPDTYTAPVTSVNGKTGSVSLDADDVGALPDDTLYAGAATVGGAATRTLALPYGEIDNTSTTTVLTATVPGITSLYDGVFCYIRNDVASSASGCTLNVNGLGALPVYMTNADATRMTTQFTAATTYMFVYNSTRVAGGCWDMYLGQVNSNTIGYQLRTNASALPMSEKMYRYRLMFTSADGTKFVPANTSSSTNATAARTTNTTPIDPWGKIAYYGTTTAVNADSTASKSYIWEQYDLTLGYSFNNTGAALVLAVNKPVYLRCTPQADNSAVMDYFVQDLPTTDDGYIYIYLGIASAATTMELNVLHPVYCHKNGKLRLWLGNLAPADVGLGTAAEIHAIGNQRGIAIDEYDDLDDYTTPGSYYCLDSTVAATLFNTPITGGNFRMEVLSGGFDVYSSYVIQFVWSSSTNGVYMRRLHGGVWATWIRFLNDYTDTIQAGTLTVNNSVTLAGYLTDGSKEMTFDYVLPRTSNSRRSPSRC